MRESEKRASQKLTNRTVIHTIPLEYRVDGTKVLGRPQGLQGTKLSVDTLLITMLSQHYDDLLEATETAGVEVEGVMAAPLAASLVTLSKAQKTAGVVLANIGSETLSIIVFDNDTPVSVKVFPVGSNDITNTIALSFQIPLPEAEQMKRGAVTGSGHPAEENGGYCEHAAQGNVHSHQRTLEDSGSPTPSRASSSPAAAPDSRAHPTSPASC